MKIIDLLNKIANRETTYDYIEYWNRNKDKYDVMLVCEENLIYKLNNGDILLTDEVNRAKGYEEEPQEHKIPEKICTNRIINTKDILEFEMIQNKINAEYTYAINKIIDKVNDLEKRYEKQDN